MPLAFRPTAICRRDTAPEALNSSMTGARSEARLWPWLGRNCFGSRLKRLRTTSAEMDLHRQRPASAHEAAKRKRPQKAGALQGVGRNTDRTIIRSINLNLSDDKKT
jgi:hypothetical protein